MPSFTIYCKTSVLADIVYLDLIDYLPDFFEITDVVVGIPPVDIPFWQSRYYAWLTARAEMDPLL